MKAAVQKLIVPGIVAIAALGWFGLSFGDEPAQQIATPEGRIVHPMLTDVGAPPASAYVPSSAPSHGHYRSLLRKFDVPADQSSYGDFYDYGFWAGKDYAEQHDLPSGYWVYVAPTWYIFKEPVTSPVPSRGPRPWGPEQATGKPDTWPRSGDIQSAWASKTPDGQPEWLELGYGQPIRPTAVIVYETLNPGAVNRITAVEKDGKETELWTGTDPTPVGKDKGVSVIPIHPDSEIQRIKIYIDSQKVPGWNEIDAVGLLDENSETHWATDASASSTYADQVVQPGVGGEIKLYDLDVLPTLRSR